MRSLRLPAIQRRTLILIDGQRSATELAALLGIKEVEDVLDPLVQAGLIRSNKTPTSVVQAARVSLAIDAEPLASAKALMQESTNQHLGVLGASLRDQISSARSREELVSVCARWHMEIRASKRGRDQADALLATLHQLLQAA